MLKGLVGLSKLQPQYHANQQDLHLASALRARVYHRLKGIKNRDWQLKLKAALLPLVFFLVYALSLNSLSYFGFLSGYAFLGLLMVVIFLNLIHEVCHENLFENGSFNQVYMYLFDLIGANSYMWQKRHVIFHHNFPNVSGWDSDIEKSKFLKVHPSEKGKWLTKYQHFIIVLYPFFLLNWFLVRDFKDYFGKNPIVSKIGAIPREEYVKLFLFKLIFIGYIFIVPVFLTSFSVFQIIWAGVAMFLVAGVFALFVLLPPHVNINNQFPEVGADNELPNSWFLHQLYTANDVNQENWFTRHVMGNFNFHIAHHLFPKVSYLYAKEVTEEIKGFCAENKLPYKSYSIWKTLSDHYKLIRNNRNKQFNIWQEDM
ncbi:fatty acid desaturase family protein [Fontibacter flavus]|uniref:Fatty acid desaturase family protein n=1 Tax=Fontibacter flavus TaxID=654838 RepID=A0ABV6FXX0_9BACT